MSPISEAHGLGVDPSQAGSADQQRDVAVIGALALGLDGQVRDLQLEVIDQPQADHAQFWTIEDAPSERRKLLASSSTASGKTTAPSSPSGPARRSRYFATVADIQALKEIPETPGGVSGCHSRERRDSNPRPPA
ncbi:MAG: hypothetical protein QOI52_1317 [Chloroflexota bacterium]|nr:hypothetical protein [Chloroflexota bacterium]